MEASQEPAVATGRVRRAGWARVSHGVHRAATGDVLRAWQLVLPPSGAFTGLTAAQRLGWWLPPLPAGLPVFVSQSTDHSRPRRAGLHVVRHPQPPAFSSYDGVRIVDPAEVVLACARHLRLLDLVVVADAALHLGSCAWDDLAEVAGRRRAGAPLLRRALGFVDGRSESAWETMLRMLHVSTRVDVEPQRVLRTVDGNFVARVDLWLVGTRAVHEYDGGVHLRRDAQQGDLRRGRRLSNDDWVRRGYTADDVLNHPVTILKDADLATGRRHNPLRIKAWYDLLDDSLFTSVGRQRFRRRLGRR